MAEAAGGCATLEELGPAEDEGEVFEYPRHPIHPQTGGVKPVEVGTDPSGGSIPEDFLYVTVQGVRHPPPAKVFVRIPPPSNGGDEGLVELSQAYDLKYIAEDSTTIPLMMGLRGVYRLFPVDALFIVEVLPERIPFFKTLGRQEFYFEVVSQADHIIYYATAVRIRPWYSFTPKMFKINLFDFDGAHVCLFDMERTLCRFKVRIHSPAVKFGTIRYTGCTMRSPCFRVRNKHFRTDFIAYPMRKKKKCCSIPHEYLIMGMTADAKVAHIGRNWPEDDFPIVGKRSLNPRRRLYGVVFEDPLRMFQKLNLLALAFAVKFIHKDFDKPPPLSSSSSETFSSRPTESKIEQN